MSYEIQKMTCELNWALGILEGVKFMDISNGTFDALESVSAVIEKSLIALHSHGDHLIEEQPK